MTHPKGRYTCGTCKHFDPFKGRAFLGVCRNMGTIKRGDKAETESGQSIGGYAVSAIVTDSAWCTAYDGNKP